MKKDAERLSELKKSMMQKGIPKSEVQRTMKLERRRAEKALARVKRDVCYNCRKGVTISQTVLNLSLRYQECRQLMEFASNVDPQNTGSLNARFSVTKSLDLQHASFVGNQ